MRKFMYKGTDRNMVCRGFQFELDKWYQQSGVIRICDNGFHGCKNPNDVFRYYANFGTNRYFLCEYRGDVDKGKDKIAVESIRFVSELTAEELLKRSSIFNIKLPKFNGIKNLIYTLQCLSFCSIFGHWYSTKWQRGNIDYVYTKYHVCRICGNKFYTDEKRIIRNVVK